ncbi:hypothetical protein EV175_003179 [Coemansia sp. RSA 1933]|nr:hypothetical protein EV175_003179 [Coemansia sp. RSA 1933]
MVGLLGATVKLVLSGDSVVLRGAQRGNQPPPERTLGLAYIAAPHLGNAKKGIEDEPLALEAREYLRRRVAGKAIKFTVRYKSNSGREYGSLYAGPDMQNDDMALKLVEEGWAKVSDQARSKLSRSDIDPEDADLIGNLVDREEYARSGKRGMWDTKASPSRPRLTTLDQDAEKFLAQNKGRDLRATIEQVRDASTLRVTLHLPTAHQSITLFLAGIKAPVVRTNVPGQPDFAEPFGEEAKFHVEVRLLQQDVKVRLESLPHGAAPNGAFIGNVIHPAGNISEWLVASGYAKVADMSVSHAEGGPAKLRQLESAAKQKRLRIWQGFSGQIGGLAATKTLEATVVRIVNGDTLVVHDEARDEDREFQLASIRQPRVSDPDQAGYADQARETLRRLCIGKPVTVTIDYHKPAQDNFRARDCATVRLKEQDLGASLVQKGLASVLRHRADDGNRSSSYDELLLAEAKAQEAKVGIHSGKPKQAAKVTNASENAERARSFITHWQRSGRVPSIVEYVSGGARLRLHIPKENCKLTFVLGGIRCPRTARNDNEAGEPFGAEALAYTTRHALQRNVEVEFESVDKAGGFIGTLWLSKDRSLTEDLLEQGLASIHEYSATQSPYSSRLFAAESRAQEQKRGMWVDYDAEKAEEEERQKQEEAAAREAQRQLERNPIAAAAAQGLQPRIEFLDVVVSEITSPTTMFIQIATQSNIKELEDLMAGLSVAQAPAAPADFAPKAGQLVSACYTAGDEWHRAKIRKVLPSKEDFDVVYIDFGNSEVVGIDRIRPLAPKFSGLAAQAHEAQLAFVRLPDDSFAPDYVPEAFAELRRLVEGKQLVANVEARPSNAPIQVTLYEPSLGKSIVEKSVNGTLASSGFALAEKTGLASLHNPLAAKKMEELVNEARAAHQGIWEYGDVTAAEL